MRCANPFAAIAVKLEAAEAGGTSLHHRCSQLPIVSQPRATWSAAVQVVAIAVVPAVLVIVTMVITVVVAFTRFDNTAGREDGYAQRQEQGLGERLAHCGTPKAAVMT